MKLKDRISADHIAALKARDHVTKSVLSVMKADIQSAEKNGQEMNDDAVTVLLIKAKKNLELSMELRADETIKNELEVINSYLPKAMTMTEITIACKTILDAMPEGLPENARYGKAMGEFNKTYRGQANPKDVMAIIKSL